MINFSNIPAEMRVYNQWVCHRKDKVPIDAKTGKVAKVSDAGTWSDFVTASNFAKSRGTGIGFVFTDSDPFIFLDFDKFIGTAKEKEINAEINKLKSYAEYSVSGNGVHVICTGDSALIRRHKSKCGTFEAYHSGRYATFTGALFPGNSKEIINAEYLPEFIKWAFPEEVEHVAAMPELSKEVSNDEIETMLYAISPDCDYETWLTVGMALKSHGVPCNTFDQWSSGGSKYKRGECQRKWKSFNRDDIKLGSLIKIAQDNGWTFGKTNHYEEQLDLAYFWQKFTRPVNNGINTKEVRAIFDNSILSPFIRAFESVMVPELPFEMVIGKALIACGIALSGKVENNIELCSTFEDMTNAILNSTKIGKFKAKVRIGGELHGIPPNFYIINVAPSGSGKDVGGILNDLLFANKWYLSGGSAEGVQDTLTQKDCACVTIAEMQNFFKENHWQHKLNSFMTEVFLDYKFDVPLSNRGGKNDKPRRSDYCALSMIGNIQPGILKRTVSTDLLESGFMGRCLFLIAPNMENTYYMPNEKMSNNIDELNSIIQDLQKINGLFEFNQELIKDVCLEFIENNYPHSVFWKRLFNETCKKVAFILSINPATRQTAGIKDEHVKRSIVFCRWIYAQAVSCFDYAEKCGDEKEFDEYKDKIYYYIKQNREINASILSNKFSYLNKKHIKVLDIINQLIIEGKIKQEEKLSEKNRKILYYLI